MGEVAVLNLVIYLRVLITELLIVVQSEGYINIIRRKLMRQNTLSLLLVQLNPYGLHLDLLLLFREELDVLLVKRFIFKVIVSELDITFLLALEKVVLLLPIEILQLIPIILRFGKHY